MLQATGTISFDQELRSAYLTSLKMIERLHRMLLDVIKDEFERFGRTDVNSVQALLLFNIGDTELTAGELKTRGLYLGSNVSYNLKKLVQAGYIHHQRSRTDKRSVRVKLTDKGRAISEVVKKLLERQLSLIQSAGGLETPDLTHFNLTAVKLERLWSDQIRYQL